MKKRIIASVVLKMLPLVQLMILHSGVGLKHSTSKDTMCAHFSVSDSTMTQAMAHHSTTEYESAARTMNLAAE